MAAELLLQRAQGLHEVGDFLNATTGERLRIGGGLRGGEQSERLADLRAVLAHVHPVGLGELREGLHRLGRGAVEAGEVVGQQRIEILIGIRPRGAR